jgi:hypothetical protein
MSDTLLLQDMLCLRERLSSSTESNFITVHLMNSITTNIKISVITARPLKALSYYRSERPVTFIVIHSTINNNTVLMGRDINKQNNNSVALVRKRTIPTERPQPVGEVTANFS